MSSLRHAARSLNGDQTLRTTGCGDLVEELGGCAVESSEVFIPETTRGEEKLEDLSEQADLRMRDTEKYLGMTLRSEALRRDQNRLAGARPETNALVSCGWWSLALHPCQAGPSFHAMVLSVYQYGLPFLEATPDMTERD